MSNLLRLSFQLPVLGLGTAPIGNLYGPVSESDARETIRTAVSCGYGLVDTAAWYGLGLAEERTGAALVGRLRSQVLLSSKVGRVLENGQAYFDFSRDGIMRSITSSLQRLRTDRLDIVFLHDPDDFEKQVLEEALPVLAELRSSGLVGAVGAAMNDWPMLSRFLSCKEFDLFLLAGRYTLLDHSSEEFLDQCYEARIPVLLGGVFNSGILATGAVDEAKFHYSAAPPAVLRRVTEIQSIAAEYGTSLPAAAVQFARSHPAVATLILGAKNPTEVTQNAKLISAVIPPVFWQRLEQQGLIQLPHRVNNN